jgi:hypothetical protein
MALTIDDKTHTPHLILWGFDSKNGKIFVDARMTIKDRSKEEAASISGITLRLRYCGLNAALLWLPNEFEMDDVINYVESYNITKDPEILNKLNEAKIDPQDMTMKSTGNNVVDYLFGG